MTNKTYRFAAVAAVLLALLVFAAPVGAEGDATSENYVAKIGGEYYSSLTSAINDASDNAIIYLNATVIEETVSPWNQIATSDHSCEKNITIYGVNHDKSLENWDENFLTIMTGGMYLGYDDMNTRDHTITVKGIVFYGNGLTVAAQKNVIIENNIFVDIESDSPAILVMDSANNKKGVKGSVTISNNYIENVSTNDVGIEVRRPYDAEISNNYVNGTGQSSILVSSNNDDPLTGYGINGKLTIYNNLLENWGQVADSKGLKDGYAIRINFADGGGSASITENGMVNDAAQEAFVKITRTTTTPDVSRNLWNGAVPTGTFNNNVPYYILGDAVTDPSKIGTYYVYDEETDDVVLVDFAVAKIGDTKYYSLAKAVEVATSGDTITLLKDAEGAGIMIETDDAKNIIIDFGGNTYTVTSPAVGSSDYETQAFHLEKGNTITLKNGEIVSEGEEVLMLVQNYCNLTLENIVLNGANLGEGQYTLSNNCGNVVITGNTQIIAPANGIAFDVYYWPSGRYPEGVSVTVAEGMTGTISGNIEYAHDETAEDVAAKAKLVIKAGTFNGNIVTDVPGANIAISGGTFSSNPSAYVASTHYVTDYYDMFLVKEQVKANLGGGSTIEKSEEPVNPETPEEPETPVEPETPTDEPVAGEPTVETEVTDGGEVTFETPAEPENPDAGEPGDAPADAPAEPAVTGVVLPEGTDSEVAFIPVSEKPAPAGKEENTKKVFEINVPKYEKGKPATVKFTMTVAELEKDGKTAADVALWHHDEETGEWTKLVTTFVIKDGIVYFEAITFDFSPFAIVYEDTELPTDEPETPEQPTESPAPILAVLAGLGAAVVLRRK